MEYAYIILLSAIQGITEFLPVSSSAHLALLPSLSGMADQGGFIDVAAHVGSLLAVMWHYRDRVVQLILIKDKKLLRRLIISFLPVLAVGWLIDPPRGVLVIAVNLIIFGAVLWVADKYGRSDREVSPITALIAGAAQLAALVPGVSRSGITISAMRARGVKRTEALDFSFMMSMPAIAAAGGLTLIHAIGGSDPVDWGAAGLAMAASCVFSLGVIRLMLGSVKKFSFSGFAVYRIILGVILLAFYV